MLHKQPPLFWEGFPQDIGTWMQGFAPCYKNISEIKLACDVGLQGLAPIQPKEGQIGFSLFMDLALCTGALSH